MRRSVVKNIWFEEGGYNKKFAARGVLSLIWGFEIFQIGGSWQERGGEKIEGVGCDPQKTMP